VTYVKKGLIAILFTINLVFITAFGAQYYAWQVIYTLEPLTETFTIDLTTTGATKASSYLLKETFAHILRQGDFNVTLSLSDSQQLNLEDAFEYLRINVEIGSLSDYTFIIVEDGDAKTPLTYTITILPNDYDVLITCEYLTKPVISPVQDSFYFTVHLVEV